MEFVDGDEENISNCKFRSLEISYVGLRIKIKWKYLSRKWIKCKLEWTRSYNRTPHISASAHCESKIGKQNLQAGEKWWKNSSYTTS